MLLCVRAADNEIFVAGPDVVGAMHRGKKPCPQTSCRFVLLLKTKQNKNHSCRSLSIMILCGSNSLVVTLEKSDFALAKSMDDM